MPTSQFDLRKLQVGLEATPGTLVAATQQLVGRAQYRPVDGRDKDDFPRGVLAPDVGVGTLVRKATQLVWETDLTYEEIIYPLLCGILNDAVPTGVGPYVWDFSRTWSQAEALKSASFEYIADDGVTKHVEQEFGFAQCESFGISIPAGDDSPAKLTSTWFGRAEQASVMTPALTPMTDRAPVAAELFGIWIDGTWATLGTTQKTELLKTADLQIQTGVAPDFTNDARVDLDFSGIMRTLLTGTLSLTLNLNADAATELAALRAGTARAIRLSATDGNKIIQIDCFGYYNPIEYAEDTRQDTASFELVLDYDGTGADIFNIQVTNDIATQP